MTTFARTLRDAADARRPLVLDGASGTFLESAGARLDDSLWSASLLAEDPGLVSRMHERYLGAGAQVVESLGYQATLEGFTARGYTPAKARELLAASWRLVSDAVAPTPGSWAAASIGPYGAFLADGSEYRGDDASSPAQLADFHESRVAVLTAAGARLFAAETVPSAREAAALQAVFATRPEAEWWLSFSLRAPGVISDGTPLAEALEAAPGAAGIGINCCPASWVEPSLEVIAAAGRPAVAYPNSGEAYSAEGGWSGAREARTIASFAAAWRDAGAAMIGGCCRTTPGDIAELSRALEADSGV